MNNKQAQFTEEIQLHQGMIHKVVFLYTNSEEERKDLKQEILTAAWSAYPRFKKESKFSTWLYRIALNTAITSLKKRKQLVTDHLEDQDIAQLSSQNEQELLQIILSRLNPIEKSLVLLLVDGVTQDEIASIVGISPGNVRVKIHRIREKLRTYGIEGFVE